MKHSRRATTGVDRPANRTPVDVDRGSLDSVDLDVFMVVFVAKLVL